MKWKKLGLVFCPSGDVPWMRSHAAVPIAEHLGGDLFRIYFSTRDEANRSYTASLVFDITCPGKLVELNAAPVLVPGALGEFDDSGAMATWLTTHDGKKHLYYIGWNLGVTVPFRNSIGLATSTGDETFTRFANGPLLDRTMTEPHFVASCCVIKDEDIWRMWYLSCTGWSATAAQPKHRYHIKYAQSSNGVHWSRDGTVAIDFAGPHEYAISRPSVLRDGGTWKMWFSCRGDAYRIGYAESTDGIRWQRKDDEAGIDISVEGWDSEMIEYPFVFDHRGSRYMLYNGNAYGKTGFGLAVLESA